MFVFAQSGTLIGRLITLPPTDIKDFAMKRLLAILLAGAACTCFAASAAEDPNYRSAVDKASADYKAAKAKCDSMSGNAKTVCVDEAKAARAHADADAVAQYNNTKRARSKAQIAAADADYMLARAKCADESGAEKTSCLSNARSTRKTAIANAKADRNVAETTAGTTGSTSTATTTGTMQPENTTAGTNTGTSTGNMGNTATTTTTTTTNSRAGEAMSDSVITTKVKAEMLKEPDLKSTAIHVDTSKGVVMLSGFVNSKTEADKAVDVARHVSGVAEVKSSIQVK
jgi:hyperosmotically inducible periplasmic protein